VPVTLPGASARKSHTCGDALVETGFRPRPVGGRARPATWWSGTEASSGLAEEVGLRSGVVGVETVAVVGSGLMGRGIAYVAALGGYRTIVHDVSGEALARALGQIGKDLDEGVARGKVETGEAQRARARLSSSTSLDEAARAADFVVEAVPEDMAKKLRVFSRLDELCRPDVVLASNTSALSIAEIAAATKRPDRVLGMHFFNPVPKMKLVEIVRSPETGEAAVATVTEVARRMGKETVLVRESPGFVTSRVNALIGNEAFCMLQEGIASARDIDKALKLGLNHPMGPFEMVDLVGLDTRLAVLEFLHQRLGEKYRPAPLLVEHVKAGRLGRKVGRGVYDYPSEE
jgi:3-hydroxybutyryl-CoA dehydrogenase